MNKLLGCLLGMTCCASTVLAEEVVLTWEWSQNDPIPLYYVVSYTSPAVPDITQQFQVDPGGRESCNAIMGNTLSTETVCARPPTCLAPGVYTFTVQAMLEGGLSGESNKATCTALAGCVYQCGADEKMGAVVSPPTVNIPIAMTDPVKVAEVMATLPPVNTIKIPVVPGGSTFAPSLPFVTPRTPT